MSITNTILRRLWHVTLIAAIVALPIATLHAEGVAQWGKQYAFVVQEDLELAHDFLVKVDVASGAVVQRFDVIENGFTYVAANTSRQKMYFVENSLDRLVELDIHSGTVQRYFVSGDPRGIAVTPDGSQVLVAQYDTDSLAVFDANNLSAGPVHVVSVGDRPIGVAVRPDGNIAYVSNAGSHSVSAVDLRVEPPVVADVSLVTPDHVTPNPLGIATSMDGNAVFVAMSNANAVAVLNTSALQPSYVADIPAFTTPIGIASNPASARAYVAAKASNVVQYLDYSAWPILTPHAPAVAGAEPYGIAVDRTGNRVLTLSIGAPAQPNNGRMSVFEAESGQLQWSLRLGYNRVMLGDFVIEEMDIPLLADGFE